MEENITEQEQAEEKIKFRVELEKTISFISSRFVGISDIDESINAMLEDIGKLSGASRAYLFLFNEDGATMDNTHEWCAEGVSPQIDNLKSCPMDMAPWWMKKLRNNETIHIIDVSKLPVEAQAEREILENQDIKSLLVLPLYIGGELNGFIGFDNVIKTGSGTDTDITLLRLSSEILGSALERKKAEETLRRSKEFAENLIASMRSGFSILDRQGVHLNVNTALCHMTGFTREELIGAGPPHPYWPKEEYENIEKAIQKTLGGEFEDFELIFKRKNGERFPVIVTPSWMTDEEGNVISYFATVKDITERKKAEEEIIRTKEYLQNIIDSASEIIISFDTNNRVTTWNNTAEFITGYKQRGIIGRQIHKLNVFDNPSEIAYYIKSICDGHKVKFDELILRTKDGAKRIIQPSISAITDDKGHCNGILFIGKDITHDREAHGRLLKGNSYLIADKNNRSALDLFVDLTKSDYNGLFITRANPEIIKSMLSSTDIQIKLLNQDKLGGFEHISDFDGLTAAIKDFSTENTDSVILLDRIDYFITRFSFERFAESLYQINSVISKNNAILMVYLNPSFLDTRQMAFIEAELQPLPGQKIEGIEIEDELFDILRFIYEQNQNNLLVSFKKISREFSIVRSTVAKRLRLLEDKGLVFIKKQGKLKTVRVSDKGKTLLNKRQII